uniref:Uncharacterized protein n=1 Tax=Timema cristinae TaxID=61476 RepID=A0A7R9GXK3_TIMCR|nr:unnamed protein product [Timema cristinae]
MDSSLDDNLVGLNLAPWNKSGLSPSFTGSGSGYTGSGAKTAPDSTTGTGATPTSQKSAVSSQSAPKKSRGYCRRKQTASLAFVRRFEITH